MNSFVRNLCVKVKDIFIREPQLIGKYYRPFFLEKTSARNVFMADGRTTHGGMFDRLKGLISVYAISKVQEKDFKIHFTSPFRLEDYLVPIEYDWRIADEDLSYSYPSSRPLFLYGECYSPRRLMKNRRCEAHFYYGYDSLDEINKQYHTSFEWGDLYRELFQPTQRLQEYINHYREEIGKEYIAIHTRFLNLLGDKMETDINPTLPQEEKMQLIETISNQVMTLIDGCEEGQKIMLASDSATFISYMQQLTDRIYVVPGEIKHIDTASQTDDSDVIKMFLDYYLLAGAKKVYSIVGKGMWPSAFPEYAAKIGNTDFERLCV